MDTKLLLSGLIGFFIGGLLVSTAATLINQPQATSDGEMSTSQMTEYDKVFIEHMIAHHESAVNMAKLSATNAKHGEIKTLSNNIIASQSGEIDQMKQWMVDWGYAGNNEGDHSQH
jgi:uncharacterized protein (DUF305 family)